MSIARLHIKQVYLLLNAIDHFELGQAVTSAFRKLPLFRLGVVRYLNVAKGIHFFDVLNNLLVRSYAIWLGY